MSHLDWKPLLAATLQPDANLEKLPYPLYASPKIDGFRCLVQGAVARSRKGLPLRNKAVQELLGRPEYEGLDGELCVGPPWAADVFNRTQNCVNTGTEAAAEEFRKHGALWVIDRYGANDSQSFKFRYDTLGDCFEDVRGAKIHRITQTLIRNAKQLAVFEAKCLAKGYEGAMLRRGGAGPYPQKPGKENRSTLREFYLVKLKRREFAEAVIVDAHQLEHNTNEEKTASGRRSTKKAGIVVDEKRIGSVTLRDGRYVFDVNVQTAALRDKGPVWWMGQRGKRVRYSYQLIGTKDAPRQPQCAFGELK